MIKAVLRMTNIDKSAGGSAKQARDRRFQAILPLRGKILNVERKDDAVLYKNNEIANLIVALGLGLKGEDIQGLRYSKARSWHCSTLLAMRLRAFFNVPCDVGSSLPDLVHVRGPR